MGLRERSVWIQSRAACRGNSRAGRWVHRHGWFHSGDELLSSWFVRPIHSSRPLTSSDVVAPLRRPASPFLINLNVGHVNVLDRQRRGGGLIVSVLYCTTVSTSVNSVTKSNRYIPVVLTRGQQRFPGSVQYTLKNTGFNIEPVCVDLTLWTGKTLPRRTQLLYPAEYFNTTVVAVFTQWIHHSEQQKETYFTKNQQQMCDVKVTSSRKQLNVCSSSTRLDHDTWTMT